MPRNQIDRVAGLPVDFPGKELVSLDMTEGAEPGIVTVYASIPSRGFPSIVRLNLFSELSGIRQHFASAFLTSGQAGTVISVTGHLADSWHIYGQASMAQQDVQAGLASTPCCAQPTVAVRPEALTLAYTEGAGPLADLFAGPFVPMGGPNGAAGAKSVSGTGTLVLPKGARLTHWLAQGTAALSAFQIHHPPGADVPIVVGANHVDGFPFGLLPAASVDYQSLGVGVFEFVS